MSFTKNDGVSSTFPAETAEGDTITIAKKKYEGTILVLTDTDGNQWVQQPVGTVLVPYAIVPDSDPEYGDGTAPEAGGQTAVAVTDDGETVIVDDETGEPVDE